MGAYNIQHSSTFFAQPPKCGVFFLPFAPFFPTVTLSLVSSFFACVRALAFANSCIMNKFSKKKPPATFEIIGPTLQILDNELRDCVARSHEGLRKGEAIWPVHQINWQRSRYVYDMYKIHGWITKECYQYCERMKMIDVNLIAKWKKSGYENLCSTFAINSKNYKFGTVSVCRVPRSERRGENKDIQDPNTGCLGCASGKGGYYNIFGNKYGQRLAAIQVRYLKALPSSWINT